MRHNVRQGLRVIKGILDFLSKTIKSPADLGPVVTHIDALTAVYDRIIALMREQDSRTRGSSGASEEARRLSRRLLRSYVRPVARMGKLLFPRETMLRAELKVPQGQLSYQVLITTAESMAERVEPHKAKFVEAGFAPDFVEKMQAMSEALRSALAQKADHVNSRSTASAGLLLEYARAREMVRLINDMVLPLLEGTSDLAGWKSAIRFVRTALPEAQEGEEENEGSTPTPSAAEVPDGRTTSEGHAA